MLMLSNSLLSQNYRLVTGSTKNLYVLDIDQSTFSLVVDSVSENGGVSSFYTQLTVSDSMNKVSQNCSFWGGAECISFAKHGLLGEAIINESDSLWYLFNDYGDTLVFNTALEVGQSRNILEYNNETFYVTCTSIQPEEFLGVVDTVKTYDIFYLDRFGVYRIYNSDISFKISKNHGLICAFDMSIFPDYTEGFTIAGSEELQKGLYRISSADVYNYAVGDIIQYRETYYKNEYPNPNVTNNVSFVRNKVLERTDNALGVFYKLERAWFSANGLEQGIDTLQQVYSNKDTLAYLPIETSFAKDLDMLTKKTLFKETLAGVEMWNLLRDNQWALRYCAQDRCFGAADTQGQVITDVLQVVLGLGDFDSEFTTVYAMNNYSTVSEKREMIYFNKQGLEWGTEAFVGMETIKDSQSNVSFYPNPVCGLGTVESPLLGKYKIIDINGKTVLSGFKATKLLKLDVSSLPNGLFMLILQNGSVVVSTRFIKSM